MNDEPELTPADLEITLASLERRGAIKRKVSLGSPVIQLTPYGRELVKRAQQTEETPE